MVDLTYNVHHEARTLADQVWVTRRVAKPPSATADKDEPKNTASYNIEVAALDDTGAPVPSAVVHLSADHPVTIVINNLSFHTDASTSVAVPTDGNGQATATFEAVGVQAPRFTLSSNADGTGVTQVPGRCRRGEIWRDGAAHGHHLGLRTVPERDDRDSHLQ